MNFTIPFGTGQLDFEIAGGADVVESAPASSIAALYIPPISLNGAERALILFTDVTRQSPDQWFAEKLLRALPLPPDRVRFLCAVGMHRPSTHAEKVAKLGESIVANYAVDDHDPAAVVQVGMIDGIPVEVNRALVEPGTLIIGMGVVEPHQYAGYSGGAKTAVIGCGGVATISQTHGPAMLEREGVRLGKIADNPFQDFVRAAGSLIGMGLAVNAVMPEAGQIAAAQFGDAVQVHDELVQQARQIYEVPAPNAPYDVVIAGVGAPKDANLYQASRAATYIGLSGSPVLREGGVIILPAPLPEGAGMGQGEQNFYDALRRFGASPALIQHLQAHGCRPGEQRAYMIAQLLQRYECIIVGADDPSIVQAAGLRTAPTIAQALLQAATLTGCPQPKTLIVPHAVQTLPVPARLVDK